MEAIEYEKKLRGLFLRHVRESSSLVKLLYKDDRQEVELRTKHGGRGQFIIQYYKDVGFTIYYSYSPTDIVDETLQFEKY